MKRLIILGILGMVMLSGCAGWTYNGVRGEDLRHPTKELVAGAATTFAVHTLGHAVYLSMIQKPWHLNGLSEVVDEDMDEDQWGWLGRIGFLTQLGVGYLMKESGADGDFMKGYAAGTMVEIATYPAWQWIRGQGDDIECIDRASNGTLEWGLYSAAAIGLNYERKEKKP